MLARRGRRGNGVRKQREREGKGRGKPPEEGGVLSGHSSLDWTPRKGLEREGEREGSEESDAQFTRANCSYLQSDQKVISSTAKGSQAVCSGGTPP